VNIHVNACNYGEQGRMLQTYQKVAVAMFHLRRCSMRSFASHIAIQDPPWYYSHASSFEHQRKGLKVEREAVGLMIDEVLA